MFDFDALDSMGDGEDEAAAAGEAAAAPVEVEEPADALAADGPEERYKLAQAAVSELESAPAASKAAAWARCEALWAAALDPGPQEASTPLAEASVATPSPTPAEPAHAVELAASPEAASVQAEPQSSEVPPGAAQAVAEPLGVPEVSPESRGTELCAPPDGLPDGRAAMYRAAQQAVAALEAAPGSLKASAWERCDELWALALQAGLEATQSAAVEHPLLEPEELEARPEPAPEAAPEALLKAAQEEAPEPGLGAAPETPPEAAPQAALEEAAEGAAPAAAPEAAPEAVPGAGMELALEASPEAAEAVEPAKPPEAGPEPEAAAEVAAVPFEVDEATPGGEVGGETAAAPTAAGSGRSNAFFDFDELDEMG